MGGRGGGQLCIMSEPNLMNLQVIKAPESQQGGGMQATYKSSEGIQIFVLEAKDMVDSVTSHTKGFPLPLPASYYCLQMSQHDMTACVGCPIHSEVSFYTHHPRESHAYDE